MEQKSLQCVEYKNEINNMVAKGYTNIQDFYAGQSIFLTGGTGFLGKALTEKLLRVCPNIKRLFVLIRKKKGKDSQQRMEDLFRDPVFDRMKKDNPEYMDKVVVIPGDVSCPDLDISDVDMEKLINEVTVVFHGAATVRFNEKLKMAIAINITGTKEMLALCSKMKKLLAFVHISTAYANCNQNEVEEIVYKPPVTADKMIRLAKCLPEETMEFCLPCLIQDWPNTYVFTKQIAEDLVRSEATDKGIPTAILRPAIVTSSYNEPVPGWIDNLYGPTGVAASVTAGLIRTVYCNNDFRAELVPIDSTVNAALAIAWDIASSNRNGCTDSDVICVYNYVTSKENPLKWGYFMDSNMHYVKRYPTKRACWYGSLTLTNNLLNFYFLHFFLHLLPAFLIDLISFVIGNKPRALKLYQKLHSFLSVISYFSTKEWNFHRENIPRLWMKLSDEDKKLFNFNMDIIDWDKYFVNYIKGINIYLLEEPPEMLRASQRRYFKLYIMHRTVQTIFFLTFIWISWSPVAKLFHWIVTISY